MRQAVKHLHAGNEGCCSSRVFLHGFCCWKSSRGLLKVVVWPSKAPRPAGLAVCPDSAVILFTSTCLEGLEWAGHSKGVQGGHTGLLRWEKALFWLWLHLVYHANSFSPLPSAVHLAFYSWAWKELEWLVFKYTRTKLSCQCCGQLRWC